MKAPPPVWVLHFRALSVSVMVGCLVLAIVEFIHALAPIWSGAYLAVLCGLVAWEAGYSYHLLHQRHRFLSDRLRFHAVEFALFFIILRVAVWFNQPDPLAAIQHWLANPLAALLDLEILLASALALMAWFAATDTLSELEQLEDPTGIPAYDEPIPNSLTSRFFIGGLMVLIFSGLAQADHAALLSFKFSVRSGVVLNVLVYFVVGLILIGQMQLARLQTLWQRQGIEVAAELPRRWARYTLIFLIVAGLIAFALPTRYTAGLLGLIADAVLVVVTVIYFLVSLVVWPVALLVAYIVSWLGLAPTAHVPIRPPPPLPPPDEAQAVAASLAPWLDYLRSIVVWVIIVGMMAYVVINYFRERPELLRALAALKPIRALRRWWAALRGRVGGWLADIQDRWPRDLLQNLFKRAAATPFSFFRLGAASPREQIAYYYLSLLRRTEQSGFARRPAQTPAEYQPTLATELPDAQADTAQMTREFIEARYSAHPIEAEQVRQMRAAWERVRALLRARPRPEKE